MSTIVNLTGISSGNPTNPQVTVTAVTDHPELFSSIVVNYTSPNTTGNIVLNPILDVEGEAIVTVTVKNTNPTRNTVTRTFKVTMKKLNFPTLDPIADQVIDTTSPLSASASVSSSPSSSPSKSPSASVSASKSSSPSSSLSKSPSNSVSASRSSSTSASPSTAPQGNQYYVSTVGSDTNSGTIAAPFKTIQHAVDVMKGGDTVYVRAGLYNEPVKFSYKDNTTGLYMTLSNYPGEEAIIDGTNIPFDYNQEGLVYIRRTNYVKISGLNIQHSNMAGVYITISDHVIVEKNKIFDTVKSGVSAWSGRSNIIVDGNDIALACNPEGHPGYTASEENISLDNVDGFEVKNNYVHKATNIGDGWAGGEGINMKDGTRNGTVHHNIVRLDERSDGKPSNRLAFGLDAWNNTTVTTNIEYYANIAFNCFVGFIVSSEQGGSVENIKVHDNVAYNMRSYAYGIPWWGGTKDGLKKNIQFINNTAYNCGSGFTNNSPLNENVVLRNNIFSKTTSNIVLLAGSESQFVIDHNLFESGTPAGTDYVTGDPLFVDPTNANFHLQTNSPAIDTGSSDSASITDFDGNSRPKGLGFDMGAFEYAPTSPISSVSASVSASKSSSVSASPSSAPQGVQYYVSTVGSDTNSGTLESPFKTIQHAVDTMKGGDTVYIRAGTYNEPTAFFYKSNTSGYYMTLTSYPGEEVIIDGTNIPFSYNQEGLIYVKKTDFVRIFGLKLQNVGMAAIYVVASNNIKIDHINTYNTVKSGIGIWSTNNAVIDSNDIKLACNPTSFNPDNSSEEFISVVTCSYVDVSNNICHDGASYPTGTLRNGGEGIGIRDGCTYVNVFNNEVFHLRRLGIGVPCFDETTGHDIRIFSNVCHDILSPAYTVHSEYVGSGAIQDVYIYNNIAYNCNWGFCHPTYAGDQPKINIQWINNTAYNCLIGFYAYATNLHDIIVRNNLFYNCGVSMQFGTGVPIENFTIDHNLFHSNDTATWGTDYVTSDPLLINAPAYDFHLQNNSPAIDTGSALGAPTTDFDGKTRPFGNGFDIGAFEYFS